MKKNKGPKDPYEDLPNDFQDAVTAMDRDQIKHRLVVTHKATQDFERAMRADLVLQERDLEAKKLAAPYQKASKDNALAANQAQAKGNEAGVVTAILAEQENKKKEAEDYDLERAKESLAAAKEPYTEAKKDFNLKVRFLLEILEAKGGA
jgi:hypothetical protein